MPMQPNASAITAFARLAMFVRGVTDYTERHGGQFGKQRFRPITTPRHESLRPGPRLAASASYWMTAVPLVYCLR